MTNSCKLLQGDCLSLLLDVPEKSVDMVCADLPYGTTACKWDTVIDLPLLWGHYCRVVKDNGAIVLHAQTPFDKVLGASNLPMLRYEWIWEKGTATGHLNAKKAPMKAHENILVFYKKSPKYRPIKTKGHKPMNAVYRNPDKSTDVYGAHCTTANSKGVTDRYPRSVLRFPVVTVGTLHPTQKPLSLVEYLVSTYTDAGDTVLDNCMGSGTTGIACIRLGRKFIGIEKDLKYFEIARNRIEKELSQGRLW